MFHTKRKRGACYIARPRTPATLLAHPSNDQKDDTTVNCAQLRAAMRGGTPVWGTMRVNARDVSAAKLYGQLGFDYAIVDSEHAPNGRSELADMGAALLAAGVCPVVRVPNTEPHEVIK